MVNSNEVKIEEEEVICKGPAFRAYQLLYIGFVILPIISGLDKFFNFLTDWEQYLSVPYNVLGNAHTTMMVVGIIEIIVGVGVLLKPRIFAYVVAVWILAIIINLLILHDFYDIALRDFGLLLAALALGSLSYKFGCRGLCGRDWSFKSK